jgi:hypothetical protein
MNSLLLNPPPAPPPPVLEGAAAPDDFLGLLADFGLAPPPRKKIMILLKGQLISKCPFGVFKSTKKPTKLFVRISALASKKR